ncbi:aminoglycoside phosphotransferase family protein [Paenibacillus mesotrionivorans]|uniref:Aminoglycoside phosphotransferase family protein n=1 Tax=Paenibacillus mesotrionivorans TaxID=3160968 RepID=A0ACC7P477_9BACL
MEPLSLYPQELESRVRTLIGPYEVLGNYRPNSQRTGVWKVQSHRDNRYYYVKTYTRKQRWHPEVYAYRHWISPLGAYAPELVSVFEGEDWQAVLITSIEGTIMRETELTPEASQSAYRKAGELTRLLHDSQSGEWFGRPDKDGNPIELSHHRDPVKYVQTAVQELADSCRAQELLSPAEAELADWALRHTGVFENVKPVPISWDSTPGNWMVDNRGMFAGMIDFENMLWGIDADTFSILFERYFAEDTPGMLAFFQGYGLEVLEAKREHIHICCIKMGLGDIYWGTQNRSARIVDYGRQLLDRIHQGKLVPDVPVREPLK